MSNRFKSKFMRQAYDAAVTAYEEKKSVLFLKDGTPHRGNSYAHYFWLGFNKGVLNWDAASKKGMNYALFRAGQDVGKREQEQVQ